MAWNRPTGVANNVSHTRRKGFRLTIALATAGIFVIALVVAGIILFSSDQPTSEGQEPEMQMRRPLPVDVVTNVPKAYESVKDYSRLSDWDIRHVSENETNNLSKAQLEYWKQSHPWPLPIEKEQPNWAKSRTSIFKEKVNNEIAFVVGIEPGTQIFGERKFDERFVKRFLSSLNKPIVINDDDSDYDKWLKQTLTDAKAELKAAYDRGEDIVQIMNDSRAELKRLAQVKEDVLSVAAAELRKKDPSPVFDEKMMVQIVNQVLEQKGIAPIEGESISRLVMKRRALRKILKEEK